MRMESGQWWRFEMNRLSANSSEPYAAQLAACSVRSRVAFLLAVAELASAKIEAERDVAGRIRAALDLVWRWEQNSDVSADALYEAVDGSTENLNDDDGIQEHMVAVTQKFPVFTIMSALYYTSWHAAIAAGEKNFPEPVCEVSEEDIDVAVDYARQMPTGFNQAAVDRLAQYCIANHKAADDKDRGAANSRETMLEVAGWVS